MIVFFQFILSFAPCCESYFSSRPHDFDHKIFLAVALTSISVSKSKFKDVVAFLNVLQQSRQILNLITTDQSGVFLKIAA